MKENLKTTTYRNGTPIPNVTDDAAWGQLTTGAYVWYDNDMTWKSSYGALYNWYATENSNGLCPSGWHVPSDTEWTQLVDYVVNQGYPNIFSDPNGAGNAIKSCRQVNSPLGGNCNTTVHPRWNSNSNHYGFDEFNFSSLPGGQRWHEGTFFENIGYDGLWWSSTNFNATSSYYRQSRVSMGNLMSGSAGNSSGFSVRCLKND